MPEEPQKPKKSERAEIVSPPNALKEKVGSGGFDEKTVASLMRMREEPMKDIDVVGTVVGHFRDRAGAVVEVARQTGRASLVLGTIPGGVVLLSKRKGAL